MKKCTTCQNTYSNADAYCPKDGVLLVLLDGLTPGTTLRRKYRIIEELGSGGMGVVYRAQHVHLKKDYAIKVINTKYASDPQVLQRFLAEAMMANRIDNPNVVGVEDADETEDGQPFVVMEYVRGKSLRQILHPEGDDNSISLDWRRAIDIASQVLMGLAAAHNQEIIHRDIKPDNILITSAADGRDTVKIVDFGIAKAKKELLDTGIHTQTGMFIGTPQYSSPEHAQGKSAELDGRADIYSLGAVLYEMLTGVAPFKGTPQEILDQHIHLAPKPPNIVRPDLNLPAELVRVVMRALSKDAASRYSTAHEMISALDRVRTASSPNSAPAPPAVQSSGSSNPDSLRWEPVRIAERAEHVEPVPTPRTRGRFVLMAVLALIFVIGAAWFAYMWTAHQREVEEAGKREQLRVQIQDKLRDAKRARAQGAYDQSIGLYSEVLTLNGENAEAKNGITAANWAKAAEGSFLEGHYDLAIKAFSNGLELDPTDDRMKSRLRDVVSAKEQEDKLNRSY